MPQKEAQSPAFSGSPWRPLPEPVVWGAGEKVEVQLSEAQVEEGGWGEWVPATEGKAGECAASKTLVRQGPPRTSGVELPPEAAR